MDNNNNAIPSMFLDEDEETENGIYPLKLKLKHADRKKLYHLGFEFSPRDYKLINAPVPVGIYQEYFDKIMDEGDRITTILEELKPFSFEEFEEKFKKKKEPEPESDPVAEEPKVQPLTIQSYIPKAKKKDFYTLFKEQINSFNTKGHITKGTNFGCSMLSLQEFRPELPFKAIDTKFLKSYELWMHDSGMALSDMISYLKSIQIIYETAIRENLVKPDTFPFGAYKFKIPIQDSAKKVLTLSLSDIKKLTRYKPGADKNKKRARDFWLLSYYCHGITIREIARITSANLFQHDNVGYLDFFRNKSLDMKMDGFTSIRVQLTTEIRNLLKEWKKYGIGSKYLFDIIKPYKSLTPDPNKEEKMISSFKRIMTKEIPIICENIGIEAGVTFETAKDSFAALLIQAGAPDEYIAVKLGFTDMSAAREYLDTLQIQTERDYMKSLVAF